MNGNKLGKIIVGLRKSKGFTQKRLADELHVSDKSLSNWERGYSLPTIETVYLFSKYFEVNFLDLMKARLEDDKDGNLVQGVIDEFNNMGNKKAKRLKKFLFGTLIIIAILIVGLFFAFNYNRFVVYKVNVENSDFVMTDGSYIETNQKDTLYLNNINIKGIEIKNTDMVSVDIYILDDNKEEKIINTFSMLDNIQIDNYDSYIEFDNLSKYFDKLYLRVTIIDRKNKIQEYTTKLKFTKDFSNSKIYLKDNTEIVKTINKTPKEIKSILLKNGFNDKDNVVLKNLENGYINYVVDANKISIYHKEKNLNYRYTYFLNINVIEALIYDENNLEIENYKYDVKNDKVIECITGKCNNYEEALKIFDKEILYLLK